MHLQTRTVYFKLAFSILIYRYYNLDQLYTKPDEFHAEPYTGYHKNKEILLSIQQLLKKYMYISIIYIA